jgi:hypothetical protein
VRRPSKVVCAAIAGVALVALAVGGGAERARAATLVGGCSDQLAQPFLPWLDPAYYVLAPDGGLEGHASGWTLRGGAKVVDRNEPFFVRSAADRRSLYLPAGSSATTPAMCAGLEHPTLRMFVANRGALLSTLKVEVLFEGPLGLVQSLPMAPVAAGPSWQPTAPLLVVANATALPIATDGTTEVAFRFTPQGASAAWSVDDVYVDPFKGT